MKEKQLYLVDNQMVQSIQESKLDFQGNAILAEFPFPAVSHPKFKFIDLFAGIGGFRIAMQNLGGQCVFTSEIDKYAQKTYQTNFGEMPQSDITQMDEHEIPDHDVLCAGFPCQAFSIAGKRGGFKDTKQMIDFITDFKYANFR
ncbi:MAG: hypothetical protein RL329_45 [Bacteroidota bacterium]